MNAYACFYTQIYHVYKRKKGKQEHISYFDIHIAMKNRKKSKLNTEDIQPKDYMFASRNISNTDFSRRDSECNVWKMCMVNGQRITFRVEGIEK